MVQTVNLHLVIDSTSYDITWSQTQTRVVFLHKLFTIRQTQDTSVTTHRFGNQIGRMRLSGMEKCCRMELHELHIFDDSFGTIHHRYSVTGSYIRICGGGIDCSGSTGSHQRHATQISINLFRLRIEDISTVALNIGRTTSNANT